MLVVLRSAWVWFAVTLLIILWLPLLAVIRLFDRDPVHYRTGRWFRNLGVAMTKVNPLWQVHLTGFSVPANAHRTWSSATTNRSRTSRSSRTFRGR